MPIPNAASAFVPGEKLSLYLLNVAHPVGGGKARWLISVGYNPDHPERLEDDLLTMVRKSADFVEEATPFGVKYMVRGELVSPSGKRAEIQTVWISEINRPEPRLITAYPHENRDNE